MKPTLALLLATALLGACSATATPKTSVKQGAAAMTTTPPAYTPPLAKGYQPGVPTMLEQIAPQSPYDADEAIRRILRIATQLHKQEDLTPAFIEQTMGLKMPFPKDGSQERRSGVYWISKNWLHQFEYSMQSYGPDVKAPLLIFEFLYDRGRWADMPDRAELCANRQMDVAAVEKILLDNGFRMTYKPNDRHLAWSYYKEGEAGVSLYFFNDVRPINNTKACIRRIKVSV